MSILRKQPVCDDHLPVLNLVYFAMPKLTNCIACKQASFDYIDSHAIADKELFTIMRETIKKMRATYRFPS